VVLFIKFLEDDINEDVSTDFIKVYGELAFLLQVLAEVVLDHPVLILAMASSPTHDMNNMMARMVVRSKGA